MKYYKIAGERGYIQGSISLQSLPLNEKGINDVLDCMKEGIKCYNSGDIKLLCAKFMWEHRSTIVSYSIVEDKALVSDVLQYLEEAGAHKHEAATELLAEVKDTLKREEAEEKRRQEEERRQEEARIAEEREAAAKASEERWAWIALDNKVSEFLPMLKSIKSAKALILGSQGERDVEKAAKLLIEPARMGLPAAKAWLGFIFNTSNSELIFKYIESSLEGWDSSMVQTFLEWGVVITVYSIVATKGLVVIVRTLLRFATFLV